MCTPEGSAVPSDNRKVPSGDSAAQSVDCSELPGGYTGDQVVHSNNKSPVMKTTNSATSGPGPSDNGASPSANQATPVEDSLKSTSSTNSCDHLVV